MTLNEHAEGHIGPSCDGKGNRLSLSWSAMIECEGLGRFWTGGLDTDTKSKLVK